MCLSVGRRGAHGGDRFNFCSAVCKPAAGTFDLASSAMEGLVATPHAIMAATRDGPQIQDTPTFRRIASLRLPMGDALRRGLGGGGTSPGGGAGGGEAGMELTPSGGSGGHYSSD